MNSQSVIADKFNHRHTVHNDHSHFSLLSINSNDLGCKRTGIVHISF